MDKVCYNCTALTGTNKQGILKPDSDGYYTLVLGAFDFPNSVGAVYPFASAKKLFESSGSLMRRLATGQCRGEYGHPKKTPGMTNADFINRILTIEETRICCHFRKIWIDTESVRDKSGKKVIAVMGEVKPCGPYGDALREQLENPNENVAFSVRSLTRDTRIGGQTQKHMTTLVVYDYVNEPGIAIATKYDNPSLEGITEGEAVFTAADLDRAEEKANADGISMESGLDHRTVRTENGWFKTNNLNSFLDW